MNLNNEHCWLIAVLGHLRWMFLSVFIPVWLAKFRYHKVLRRLRKSNGQKRIKVLFVTGTPAKWKCQSLYDLMSKSGRYEPCICQTICDVDNSQCTHEERIEHLDRCKAYYTGRGMSYVEAYAREHEAWIDLNDFSADIVFYNQPWDVAFCQLPSHVAKSALTFQVPYYVPNYGDISFDIQTPFQRTLFGYCALNREWAKLYRRNVSPLLFSGCIFSVGHTALDPYFLRQDKRVSNKWVIYAPHWSIDCPGNENCENYSTFLQTGKALLKFAKNHPEIAWVFRPHPTLRKVLSRTRIWSESEINSYYADWAAIGALSEGGDYEGLFLESSVMITDCGSFLMEYACTGNPIVHLISSTCKVNPVKPSAELYATYYQVHDINELGKILEKVVIQHQDPKRDERLEKVREAGLLGNYAAQNIVDELDWIIGFKK